MNIKLSDGRELSGLPPDAETAALVTEIGGSLDTRGYAHPLPALTTVGGSLDTTGYAHPLPALTTVGGYLDTTGYAHPLPALTTVGGYLDTTGYAHPLPALTTVGCYLDTTGYAHPLPALTTIGGPLDARGYAHPLPALTTVGGSLIADAPFVENIHKRVFDAAKADSRFDMGGWGKETPCGTGRCRGGHVVNQAGRAGFELKEKTDFPTAALLIYLKNDPELWRKGYPNFEGSVKNDDAMADMKRCAELESESKPTEAGA
jgi:hypothetical protein